MNEIDRWLEYEAQRHAEQVSRLRWVLAATATAVLGTVGIAWLYGVWS